MRACSYAISGSGTYIKNTAVLQRNIHRLIERLVWCFVYFRRCLCCQRHFCVLLKNNVRMITITAYVSPTDMQALHSRLVFLKIHRTRYFKGTVKILVRHNGFIAPAVRFHTKRAGHAHASQPIRSPFSLIKKGHAITFLIINYSTRLREN